MINSGLSLLRALTILTEQTESKELARVLGEVRNDVETGNSLSGLDVEAPERVPAADGEHDQGRRGRRLPRPRCCCRSRENYEAEVKLRGKIKAAMTYPVVVFVIAILTAIGMLLFIVPVFVGLFADLDAQLPAAHPVPGLPLRADEDPVPPLVRARVRRVHGRPGRR